MPDQVIVILMKTLRTTTGWFVLLLTVWFMLTAGSAGSWIIGLPFVALAIWFQPPSASSPSQSGTSFNIGGLMQFTYFFIAESLRGGIDVSRRVLSSRPRIDADFYDYAMRLQKPHAQKLFISSISLLPGTLCADLNDSQLRIHTLDRNMDTPDAIRRLESLVGKTFGEAL